MVELAKIATDLLIGRKYYSEQLSLLTTDLENGCGTNCNETGLLYLAGIILYLESDIASTINNDDTQAIYKLLLIATANNIGIPTVNPNVIIPGVNITVITGTIIQSDIRSFNYPSIGTVIADGLTSIFLIPHGYTIAGVDSIPAFFDVEGLNENSQDGEFTITANTINLIVTYTSVYPVGLMQWYCTVSRTLLI